MPADSQFNPTWGTALATFTQTGTYSSPVQLNKRIQALYSDNYPAAAGSIIFRASISASGSGYPVMTEGPVAAVAGTQFKVLSFGSGTYYDLSTAGIPVPFVPYCVLQVGTAGTAGIVAGGTIVIVTG